jgi:ankyrin repeat protein
MNAFVRQVSTSRATVIRRRLSLGARAGMAMTALALGLAPQVAQCDAAKARKKLDDDYVPVTTRELSIRVTRADLKVVALLIEAGVDVNSADDDGTVPLHTAAGADRTPSAMPLLVKAGARLDALDSAGDTPLCRALHASLPANALWLLAAGADPKLGCKESPTLHVAVAEGMADVVSALLAKGAAVNAANGSGETPLFQSVSLISSNAAVTKALMAAGGDVQAPSKAGRTPLHEAARRQNAELTRLLLDAGAKVDARDREGETPLFLAANVDGVAVIPLLLAAGADPRIANVLGVTPLKIAETTYSTRALELLRAARPR